MFGTQRDIHLLRRIIYELRKEIKMRKKNEAIRSEQVLGEILLRYISQNAGYLVHEAPAAGSDFINQVETEGENYERQCSIQNASDIFQYGLILREQQEHIKEITESVHHLEDAVEHLEKQIKKNEKKLKKKSQEVNALRKKSCRQKVKSIISS